MLRSRAELQTIRGNDDLDQDPRALAIKAVITRLGREAIQLYNEVATTRPKEKPDPARKAFLQLEAGDAIIRSSVRVGDLDLIRVGNQLDFFEELIKDNSLPIPILHEARSELGADHARLQSRLATVQGDRLTLDGQRELVSAQATDSKSAAVSPLGTVQDLAQLLDFQQADIMRLQQRLDEMVAKTQFRDRPERVQRAPRTSFFADQPRTMAAGEGRTDPPVAEDCRLLAGDFLGSVRSARRSPRACFGWSRRGDPRAVRRPVGARSHRAGTDCGAEPSGQVKRAAGGPASEPAIVRADGRLDRDRPGARRGRASHLVAGGGVSAVAAGSLPARAQHVAVRGRERARGHAPSPAHGGALVCAGGHQCRRSRSRGPKRSHAAVRGRPRRPGGVCLSAPDRPRDVAAARGPAVLRTRQTRRVACGSRSHRRNPHGAWSDGRGRGRRARRLDQSRLGDRARPRGVSGGSRTGAVLVRNSA